MLQEADKYIREVIRESFRNAVEEAAFNKAGNRDKSRIWVNCLAQRFKTVFDGDDIRVFSKHDSSNRKEFKLNEFLYDITVSRKRETLSVAHNKKIPYIKEAIWLVESELGNGTGDWAIDFSKLIIGTAPNKLFIAPYSEIRDKILDALLPLANDCSGNVFLAFIPYPDKWETFNEIDILIYKFANDNWIRI